MEQIDEISVQVSKKSYTPIDNQVLAKYLPKLIQVVQSSKEEQEVYDLWDVAYKEVYPDYEINRNDLHNKQAHILYTRDEDGHVASSIRLTIDSPLGIPTEEYHPPEVGMLRERGYKLMEFGRMVRIGSTLKQLKTYYRAIYQIAKAENIDVIVMTLKQKDVAFHRHLMGAHILLSDMGIPLGGKNKMSSVIWEIKQTKPRFFKWTGLNKQIKGEVV